MSRRSWAWLIRRWSSSYVARRTTRFENAEVIAAARGYRTFVRAEAELSAWIDDLAWTTGDGPKALVDAATGWLLKNKVLLPGVSWRGWSPASATARSTGCGACSRLC